MKKPLHFETGCAHCNVRLNSVFNVLQGEQLTEMSMHKSCNIYKKGQYVFAENGLPTGLFCVNSGKIKITTTGYDGKEQILRLAKSGDIVGYRALISNERYASSAVTLEDASICVIDKDYFFKAMEATPKLMFEVVKKMGRDLKEAEDHIVSRGLAFPKSHLWFRGRSANHYGKPYTRRDCRLCWNINRKLYPSFIRI
ncbi:MAG: Crp/Fnr family transcriptional regulator [Chitinophagaceae bacterium]|nr:MAG: Crp/Fnr family transcriptional regulator [Chitinophagaceae bacterium]